MKKQIALKLSIFVVSILAILLIVNITFHYRSVLNDTEDSAFYTLDQLEAILDTNAESLETLTESLQEEYIIRVQAVAYILENIDISTESEYAELATLLDVDEIHVFSSDGVIYEGSVAEYYGYNFESGEQMSFFLPLLEDTSLTLCQDITPNTAEDKPMMYIATWNSNASDIIQIGINPERILEEQSLNELSYIFGNLPTGDDIALFAIDASTGVISGSTVDSLLYLDCTDIGLNIDTLNTSGNGFYKKIEDTTCYCIFIEYNDSYLGYVVDLSSILSTAYNSVITASVFFIITAFFLYLALLKIIDVTIIKDVENLIGKVSKIASGDLDTKVDIDSSYELQNLSTHINMMVSSLLNTTARMSHVLDFVDTGIAVYEYKPEMRRVFATRKLGDLLTIEPDELEILLDEKTLFEEKICTIKSHPAPEEGVYMPTETTYIKIETLDHNDGQYGVIIDVTEEVLRNRSIIYERDYDILTDIYNRRAFYREMDELFENPEELKECLIMALDMDNLKEINDTYGHDAGDRAIKISANLMKEIPTNKKVIGRIGGDEFLIFIYGENGRISLYQYIDHLRELFDESHIGSGPNDTPIKMSAGYLMCSTPTISYHKLIKQADETLYTVKNGTKNQFLQLEI